MTSEPRTSVSAVLSPMFGIASVAFGFYAASEDYPALMTPMLLSAVLAIGSAVFARRRIRRSKGMLVGRGWTGWGIGTGVIGMFFAGLLPAV